MSQTITPGPGPGTLHVKGSYLAGKEWDGTVQADGSVVLVGRGLLKAPHRMVLTDDGAMEIRLVKLKAGQVVSETSYNRCVPVNFVVASATANASGVPADRQALASIVPTPAPAPPVPPQPRMAEELEAQAAALQEQAAALRRAQADAAEQEAGA